MTIDHGIWVSSKKELDEIIQDARTDAKKVEAISFGSNFKKQVNWDNEIESIGTYLPNLQHLTFSQQYIPGQSLRKIEQLSHLKGLSLYWSGIDDNNFFDQLPNTLEYLDLSRTRACINHSTEQLKQLLERLNNLNSLNLAETQLKEFPKLEQAHASLTELELFHHTIGDSNHYLNDDDLQNIFDNFPNLKKLNINACPSIDINNPKTKKIVQAFSQIEDFELYADEGIRNYFRQCKNSAYLKQHFNLQSNQLDWLLQDSKKVEHLTNFGSSFLLEKIGLPPEKLIRMYEEQPIKFGLLTSAYFVDCLEKKILTYSELNELCDKYGTNLNALINYNSLNLMKEKGVSFSSLLSLFEKNPNYLAGMLTFFSRYDKSKEMIEVEIEMLVKENVEDKATFKKLDKQNYDLKTFILDNSNGLNYSGEDIVNILYNLPSLDFLKFHSGTKLRQSEKDIALAKETIEAYCLANPKFELSTSLLSRDNLIEKIYQRAKGIRFYAQTCMVPIDALHRLEQNNPKQFEVFLQPPVQSLMRVLSITFSELSALYSEYQDALLKLASTAAQEFLKEKLLTFKEIADLYTEDHVKFDKLINYKMLSLTKKHSVTWDEINQLYAKNPEALDELGSLAILGENTTSELHEKVNQLLHVDKVSVEETELTDSVYESESNRYGLERDKNQLKIADNLISFFYGTSINNTKLAFDKDQAYLAAKWYLRIIEEEIPTIYHQLHYTPKKMELTLTFDQKNEFVETLANSIWYRLKNDVRLNIKGNSPLYLNWSDEYITNALHHAKIDIDNSKQLKVFAFIGQKGKTTYQFGDEVGNCSDYLRKPELIPVENFRPRQGK